MIKYYEEKCNKCLECIAKCKFNAITFSSNKIMINDNCVNCNSCVKACKTGALVNVNSKAKQSDFNEYKGILVFVQIENNEILPISKQLINKAYELSLKLNENVYAVVLSNTSILNDLTKYGIDTIYNYTNSNLKDFTNETYISALYDAIQNVKPSIVLIGATNEGRQIASHLAHKFDSGITCDCTDLRIVKGNLLQVRPAYGGKIMAEILTENTRPQFATCKNGVFDMPKIIDNSDTKIVYIDKDFTPEKIKSISLTQKENLVNLEKSDIILCLGSAVKNKEDMLLFEEVAKKLNATLAGTRALVEKGFISPSLQIGLSGTGVSPKLLITFGVSGSIQFLAGCKGAKKIIAVNTDKNANILKVANYSIVEDIYALASEILKK